MKKILMILLLNGILLSLPYWDEYDFIKSGQDLKGKAVFQWEIKRGQHNFKTWSYIHELFQTASFLTTLQVSDTNSPNFGGMIEGENAMNIIETDNTQEAIWVWSRYMELTGDTIYKKNIRRAWIYVKNFPAWKEEGTTDYYRVWNCGLGLFAEQKYREVTQDTSYKWYADSCILYILTHDLPFTGIDTFYKRLHPKVQSFVAGCLYLYAKSMNDSALMDSAIEMAIRVKNWVEQDPNTRLNDEVWAMSGGTVVWGLCNSIFKDDSISGYNWLNTYIPLMKYYQPTGEWNNSWNIWYARAYDASARIAQKPDWDLFHHELTDTLLIQDLDNDGGVPPTKGGPPTGDHSWISSYMVFMGFENLMDSIKNYDVGVAEFLSPNPNLPSVPYDTIPLILRIPNYGFQSVNYFILHLESPFTYDTTLSISMGEEKEVYLTDWIPNSPGNYNFEAYTIFSLDERNSNDTSKLLYEVKPYIVLQGWIKDSVNQKGIKTKLEIRFLNGNFYKYTMSDTNGYFITFIPESTYTLRFLQKIPYPEITIDSIEINSDTFIYVNTAPSQLLVINRDSLGKYNEYYKEVLDSLNLRYCIWVVRDSGIFNFSKINEFENRLILWFTGDSKINTVSTNEQESLKLFLQEGGKLLITGQNIGEDIGNTSFYTNYLHAIFVAPTHIGSLVFPINSDSLGSNFKKISTIGAANNQNSKDIILNDSYSHLFLTYDTLNIKGAGIWYNDINFGYKIIYFPFGLEAVKNVYNPSYSSRYDIIRKCLEWLGIEIKVKEKTLPRGEEKIVFPNILNENSVIHLKRNSNFEKIRLIDICGRKREIRIIPYKDVLKILLREKEGIYFLKLKDKKEGTFKLIIIK
ncbi:MAG: T9SS type A sorting domain-containing protein [candidate division WOR-3 bacterium]